MRRLPWALWLLLPLVVVAPVLRFAMPGHAIEFGAQTHVQREPFSRTPWISGSMAPLLCPSFIGFTVAREPALQLPLIVSAPFVPPEA